MRAALACLLAAACSAPARPPAPTPSPAPAGRLHATVRWTSDGVPHVRAADWRGLGFGQGWALARLHLCVVAAQVLRVRGQRARFFGAGVDDANLDSDFFHRHLGFRARAEAALAELSSEPRQLLAGFAAGYNHYLARTPAASWPAPCRGAAWVRPVDEVDL